MNIYFSCISLLAVAYFCKSVLIPIAIAIFLSLALAPLCQKIEKFYANRGIASLLSLTIFLFICASLSMSIATPMSEWTEKLPNASKEIGEKITEMSEPIADLASLPNNGEDVSNEFLSKAFSSLISTLASSTPALLLQILATTILTFFILCYGDDILRKLVEIQNSFQEKKVAVEISRTIQSEISNYLFMISIINLCLGASVTLLFYIIGINDPILWGVAATLFNFAPYLGPTVLIFILFGVGFVQYGFSVLMILPPLCYVLLNIFEAYFITPTALGRRLSLNPLIVFLWIMVWGWLWGAAGALIGVPMLVAIKVIIQKTGIVGDWSNIIEEATTVSTSISK